jgi:transposase, IS30 family
MYKRLSREERYQIHCLIKAKHTLSEITQLSDRHRSTISREIARGQGRRGYCAEQACNKAHVRAQNSRNATRVQPWVWSEVAFYLGIELSPEQIANKLTISHEAVYQHVYADKVSGGKLHKGLRSQKNPGANASWAGVTGVGRFPTDALSVSASLTLKGASVSSIGRVTRSSE